MFLPTFRRIFKSDYDKDDQALVEKLSSPVNSAFEVLYEALNKKLDFTNNFQATEVDIPVTVDSTGTPVGNASFKLINSNKVKRLWIGNAQNLTNPGTYVTGAPFASFLQNGASITIVNITGLQPGNTYLLNILAT